MKATAMGFDDMQRTGSGWKRRRMLSSPIARFDPISRQGIADLRESGGGRVCAEHAGAIHSFEQPFGFVGCFGRHKHQLIWRWRDVDASAEIGHEDEGGHRRAFETDGHNETASERFLPFQSVRTRSEAGLGRLETYLLSPPVPAEQCRLGNADCAGRRPRR